MDFIKNQCYTCVLMTIRFFSLIIQTFEIFQPHLYRVLHYKIDKIIEGRLSDCHETLREREDHVSPPPRPPRPGPRVDSSFGAREHNRVARLCGVYRGAPLLQSVLFSAGANR